MFPDFVIFGKTIALYQVLSLAGIFAAGIFACVTAKKRGYDDNDMIVLLLISGIGVLIGSHLLYGITNYKLVVQILSHLDKITSWRDFFNATVLVFGGSVFYGGLIGGMIAGVKYAERQKLNMSAFSDMIAPAVPLLHAFGRVGCFLGGCCYGVPGNIGFVYTHALIEEANGVCRFPIQLVEAGFNLALFAVLYMLLKKDKFQGRLFSLYLILYPIGRFILEFWRGDAIRGVWFGVSTSQIISVVIFAAAVFYFKKQDNKQRV